MQFLNEDKRSWKDLTDEEKGKLLLAFHEGKVIQELVGENEGGNRWYDFYDNCDHPAWVHGIWRIKPAPVKKVLWGNDYEDDPTSWWHPSREEANKMADVNRIAVIRREIVDGVVSYYREDV